MCRQKIAGYDLRFGVHVPPEPPADGFCKAARQVVQQVILRHPEREFRQVLAKPGHKVFAFACEDIFGDYGIVGFGQYRVGGKTLTFTEFAMSCRVAGKFVGSALFAALLEREGCSKGHFTVVKTRKNILLRDTLENIGFTIRETTMERVYYTFNGNLLNRDIVQLK